MATKPTTKPTTKPNETSEDDALTPEKVAALFELDAADVFAFKDYDTYVVCVTTAGQKLQANKHA